MRAVDLALLALACARARVPSAQLASPVQLVDDKGTFHDSASEGLRGFAQRGLEYGVVAVVGPQSSGKSSLLNALFGARFETMEASSGRSRTTRGVWMMEAPERPGVLLLDLQGTDSCAQTPLSRAGVVDGAPPAHPSECPSQSRGRRRGQDV